MIMNTSMKSRTATLRSRRNSANILTSPFIRSSYSLSLRRKRRPASPAAATPTHSGTRTPRP